MNNSILLGRITKDPELRQTAGGKDYCRFTLAVDRGNDQADFIPCMAWGESATNTVKYVRKGRQLLVQGKLQSGSYQDSQGTTRYTLDLFVYRIKFLAMPRGQQGDVESEFRPMDDNDEMPF
ncbi:MAG TPA: single-stranded DNA-binding protein [Clostridia bacterium]|nr:single-stranded DNA-binding protein [Clostridia bacterium]